LTYGNAVGIGAVLAVGNTVANVWPEIVDVGIAAAGTQALALHTVLGLGMRNTCTKLTAMKTTAIAVSDS
jgi:hypothetical protein